MTLLPPSATGRRLPALDGLRAVAVVGVIAFHAFPSLAPGGFAGVDVFFVLSGFLITGGLLELRAAGRPLVRFWIARARRLLPALVVLVLVVGPLVLLVRGDAGVGFGAQAVSAALFVTNWHLVATGSSYFAESSPPVLQHLWSLAVEEQFYLVWPVVLLALCGISSRSRVRLATVLLLAAVSLGLMITFAATGHVGRGYYGSDSHSFGLLAGAALAMSYAARPARTLPANRIAPAAGLALLGLLAALRGLDGNATATYAWGLPAVVGLTLLLVHLAVTDTGVLERTLGGRVLRATGQRSYGLYLWHWPLLVLVRNALPATSFEHPVLTGSAAIGATVLAASASYRWIEVPIRRHGLRGCARGLWSWAGEPQPYRRRTAFAVTALPALALVLTMVAVAHGPRTGVEQRQVDAGIAAIRHAAYPTPVPTPPAPGPRTRRPVTGRDITAVGDSVMLAAAPALLQHLPGIDIDAVVSRQGTAAPGILAAMARRHTLRPVVLVGLGTNGNIATSTLDAIRAAIGPDRQLVLVNVFVPREWQTPVDDELGWYAAHHPHTTLVDWHDAIAAHPDLLGPDHIHPGPAGGDLYAQTVAAALAPLRVTAPPAGPVAARP